MPSISPHIFREYDIRGEVPEELNDAVVREIARAFARKVATIQRVSSPKISLGWDGRLSSPSLKQAVSEGLQQGGAHVVEVGLGPTPLTYYSVFKLQTDGCIMITGSHNPPAFNGLKLMVGKRPFFGEMIQELYQDICTAEGDDGSPGTCESVSIIGIYLQALIDAAGGYRKPLRVVWDAGNGASGEIVQQLVTQLPGTHQVLFGEIDGTFPNHHPDPSVEKNMQDLRNRVLEIKADIGIAFDGDGDRIGVIDNEGRMWAGDQLLAVLAKDVLAKHPGAQIIADVKTSQAVFDAIASYGGKGVMYKTGHSNVKSKLAELGAPLAGEMSGHVFFADTYYGIDDALYAACRLLNILGNGDSTAADLYNALPKWHSTPEMRIECVEEKKFAIIEEIARQLKAEGQDYSDIDGVRVNTSAGWWLVRASNTQAVLVARAEAKESGDLPALKAELNNRLAPFGISL